MHILGICALVLGLAALLIMGFLNVVQALLSRSIFEAPSCADEAWGGETDGYRADLEVQQAGAGNGERYDDSRYRSGLSQRLMREHRRGGAGNGGNEGYTASHGQRGL